MIMLRYITYMLFFSLSLFADLDELKIQSFNKKLQQLSQKNPSELNTLIDVKGFLKRLYVDPVARKKVVDDWEKNGGRIANFLNMFDSTGKGLFEASLIKCTKNGELYSLTYRVSDQGTNFQIVTLLLKSSGRELMVIDLFNHLEGVYTSDSMRLYLICFVRQLHNFEYKGITDDKHFGYNEKVISKINKEFSKGNFKQTLILIGQVKGKLSENCFFYLKKVQCLQKLRDWGKLEELLLKERVNYREIKSVNLYLYKYYFFHRNSSDERTLNMLKELCKEFPKDSYLCSLKGMVMYFASRDFSFIDQHIKMAKKLQPDSLAAYQVGLNVYYLGRKYDYFLTELKDLYKKFGLRYSPVFRDKIFYDFRSSGQFRSYSQFLDEQPK